MKFPTSILLILIHLDSAIHKQCLAEYVYDDSELPLKSYEKLDYENFEFKSDTSRSKRDTQVLDNFYIAPNRLKFRAFNRNFNLILRRDEAIVGDNLSIELRYSNKPSEFLKDSFSSNYFRGIVENESYSEVIVYFEEATQSNSSGQPLIFAHIRIINGTNENNFYIEPFQSSGLANSKFKYLVYRTEDIDSNILSNGVFNTTVCHPKYAKANSQSKRNNIFSRVKSRTKRQNRSKKLKNRCHLALVADHKFYKEIGNSNDKLITAYMVMNIIVAVNNIFTGTKWIFDEGKPNSNYGFSIDKIIIHKEPTINVYNHYNNKNSSKNADTILNLFGKEDWSNYCLAHLFTYQNFENSVLGLAYVSSPLPYSIGGICSEPSFFREKSSSVNTGLSSYKSISSKQGRLLQKEAELVTAHELGHNWGSEHDPSKPDCMPSPSEGGNYLMYSFSNSGNDKNNM
ncbi:adam 17-like protease, partial [Brachionus plicatilis]